MYDDLTTMYFPSNCVCAQREKMRNRILKIPGYKQTTDCTIESGRHQVKLSNDRIYLLDIFTMEDLETA